MRTVITGSGSFIPANIIKNTDFGEHVFYDETGKPIDRSQHDIISKFQQITGIEERRYAGTGITTAFMAASAAAKAIEQAGIDAETIDQVIVAHNFGEVTTGVAHADMVPSIASRVKNQLGIRNPSCVAYDILFGCPGWLQGLIQANAFIRAGVAKKCLVIGVEILSRVSDPYDRDSMIYSDGAGAVIVEMREDADTNGVLGTQSASFAGEDLNYINMGASNQLSNTAAAYYLKMQGRKVYEFALKYVPQGIKSCLDNCGVPLSDVRKIFIHQANEKMDEAIIDRLFKLYQIDIVPKGIMPMNIKNHGNSSVATIPTLYDMVSKGLLEEHSLHKDDIIVFASVGAGMNINAVCYRM